MVDGNPHGKGIYKWEDGRSYDGEWIHNKIYGYGEYKWPDGKVYKGNVKIHSIINSLLKIRRMVMVSYFGLMEGNIKDNGRRENNTEMVHLSRMAKNTKEYGKMVKL